MMFCASTTCDRYIDSTDDRTDPIFLNADIVHALLPNKVLSSDVEEPASVKDRFRKMEDVIFAGTAGWSGSTCVTFLFHHLLRYRLICGRNV